MVHREQAEEVVVVLGHRLAGPVPVRRADLELLVAAAELHGQHPAPARTSSVEEVALRPSRDHGCDDRSMDVLCSGYGLVESPRWHDGRLWFSDWTGGQIVAVDDAGRTEVVLEHRSLPLCFDFLPDGRLVLVSNQEGALLTLEPDGTLATYADLTAVSDLGCNDIVVDGRGYAFVNSPHFDFATGPPPGEVQPGRVGVVTPDGVARVVADDLAFPNGMAVTADGADPGRRRLLPPPARRLRHRARTARCPDAGSGPTSARTTRTGSASTPPAPPGTPTSRTSAASGWPRAARCSQVVDLDRGGFACMLGGAGRDVPLRRHRRLARRGRAGGPHRMGRPGACGSRSTYLARAGPRADPSAGPPPVEQAALRWCRWLRRPLDCCRWLRRPLWTVAGG